MAFTALEVDSAVATSEWWDNEDKNVKHCKAHKRKPVPPESQHQLNANSGGA
jgi:hypothetical protein